MFDRQRHLAALLALVVVVIPGSAVAGAITGVYSGIYGTSSDTTDSARLCVSLSPGPSCGGGSDLMTPYLTTTGTFQVFTFDVTSDPIAFPMFVALLTNGAAEPLRIFFQTQASDLEQIVDVPYGPNGIDLGGFAIEKIELEVDPYFHVTPRTPLSGSNVGGGWGIRVFGAYVPEPSTALLIGMGLSVLSRRRRVAN